MITRGLRSFLDRDWAAVREAKDAYWAEVTRLDTARIERVLGRLEEALGQSD